MSGHKHTGRLKGYAWALGLEILILMLFFSNRLGAFEFKDGTYTLTVVKVMDKNLPILSDEEVNAILSEASRLIQYKLKEKVEFIFKGAQSVDSVFDVKQKKKFLQLFKASHQINIFDNTEIQAKKMDRSKSAALRDLKDYVGLPEINSFLGVNTPSYEKAFKIIKSKYLGALKALTDIYHDPQSPYFKKGNSNFWLLTSWGAALAEKKDFDVFLTNEPIMTDVRIGGFKNLHLVAQGAAFGFASCAGVVISTFTMEVHHPFFNSFREGLDEKERVLILGELLAHYIGNYLFGMQPVYLKEDRGCLMHRDIETLYHKKRYLLLNQMGPCQEEVAWSKLTEFFNWWDAGKKSEALKILKDIENHYFPERYDGLFRLASIYYVLLNRPQDTEKIYKKVLNLHISKKQKKEFWETLRALK